MPRTLKKNWPILGRPCREAHRSLCTALQFTTENGVPKTLTLTSAGPGEGKSLTSLAIAKHFATMGRKVLLVDADLRNPSLHVKLKSDNSVGLSNYLTGACAPPEACRGQKFLTWPSWRRVRCLQTPRICWEAHASSHCYREAWRFSILSSSMGLLFWALPTHNCCRALSQGRLRRRCRYITKEGHPRRHQTSTALAGIRHWRGIDQV